MIDVTELNHKLNTIKCNPMEGVNEQICDLLQSIISKIESLELYRCLNCNKLFIRDDIRYFNCSDECNDK